IRPTRSSTRCDTGKEGFWKGKVGTGSADVEATASNATAQRLTSDGIVLKSILRTPTTLTRSSPLWTTNRVLAKIQLLQPELQNHVPAQRHNVSPPPAMPIQ